MSTPASPVTTTPVSKTPAKPKKETVELDPELKAMSTIIRVLSGVPPAGQARILAYLTSKFSEESPKAMAFSRPSPPVTP